MFNYYRDRLDITLPSRLVQEGFPVHILSEQRRMHPVLARFPADHIYPGKLKSAPGRNISINEQMPGLREVLVDIIAGTITDPTKQEKFKEEVTDNDLRRHYIEVSGTREKNPVTHSSIVYAHVDVFFNKIFPKLRQYFREKKMNVEKNVMIICAYGFAVSNVKNDIYRVYPADAPQVGEYKKRFQEMREKNKALTADDIPRVLTIDSSQGDESFMVFFDASAQHCNDIGMRFFTHDALCSVL
jgi:superfamily I DNA and/or RNA helicase